MSGWAHSEDFRRGKKATKLGCSHHFHTPVCHRVRVCVSILVANVAETGLCGQCIRMWLEQQHNCPVCRCVSAQAPLRAHAAARTVREGVVGPGLLHGFHPLDRGLFQKPLFHSSVCVMPRSPMARSPTLAPHRVSSRGVSLCQILPVQPPAPHFPNHPSAACRISSRLNMCLSTCLNTRPSRRPNACPISARTSGTKASNAIGLSAIPKDIPKRMPKDIPKRIPKHIRICASLRARRCRALL